MDYKYDVFDGGRGGGGYVDVKIFEESITNYFGICVMLQWMRDKGARRCLKGNSSQCLFKEQDYRMPLD